MRAYLYMFGTIVSLCLAGCGQNPKVDVQTTVVGDKVIFEVPWKGANGLLGFSVTDETGKVLWDVDLSYEQGHKITYGALPAGGNMDARQVVPEAGVSPPDIKGKRVNVSVEYQYDDPMPSSGTFDKTVQIPTR